MNFLISSDDIIYKLTPRALDLINFFVQFLTAGFAILFGLLILLIILIIFK